MIKVVAFFNHVHSSRMLYQLCYVASQQNNPLNGACRDEMSDLKDEKVKAEWRQFCDEFKDVSDFNFATLVRLDSSKDYEEANSVIVTKIQFYAIELVKLKILNYRKFISCCGSQTPLVGKANNHVPR